MGEGEGGMIWENGIETCITSYMKHIASQARCMILDAWDWCTGMTQRDGYRKGGGKGVQDWEHVCTVVDSC